MPVLFNSEQGCTMRFIQISLAALAMLALVGCANPLTSISANATGVEKYQSRDAPTFGEQVRASQTGKVARGEVINILTLSGGGAWGAWGAGFLSGWKENFIDRRPEHFDVVTGIST